VSEQPDPERLLAEALRAQAVRAPLVDPASQPGLRSGPGTGHGGAASDRSPFGPPNPLVPLLSGTDSHHDLISGRTSDTLGLPVVGPRPQAGRGNVTLVRRQLSGWWIVVLAVLLGAAAGAVVGLISLL
jgi:hypothetical protein